jgi:hypothetical protein
MDWAHDVSYFFAGVFLTGVMLARTFGRHHGGNSPQDA